MRITLQIYHLGPTTPQLLALLFDELCVSVMVLICCEKKLL